MSLLAFITLSISVTSLSRVISLPHTFCLLKLCIYRSHSPFSSSIHWVYLSLSLSVSLMDRGRKELLFPPISLIPSTFPPPFLLHVKTQTDVSSVSLGDLWQLRRIAPHIECARRLKIIKWNNKNHWNYVSAVRPHLSERDYCVIRVCPLRNGFYRISFALYEGIRCRIEHLIHCCDRHGDMRPGATHITPHTH